MVTEIAPRHQREVFSPHPDDPYLSVEIGLYYLISRFRKQVGVLLRLRRDDLERRWCAAHSVGFPSRPGLAAYGGGRDANAYPPDRAAHFLINDSLLRAEMEGRIRLLRRCRRACATSPGIGVKPSFRLRSSSRYKSSRL